MYTENFDMKALFDQLGLDSSRADIEKFCSHNKLPDGLPLHKAAFWSESQARFLREEIAADAGWAPVVDELNVLLRGAPEGVDRQPESRRS